MQLLQDIYQEDLGKVEWLSSRLEEGRFGDNSS